MIIAPGRPLTIINWTRRNPDSSVRFAVEAGRAHHGRWFAYVNVGGRNYWLRRYS
jgi:hypothetical protein